MSQALWVNPAMKTFHHGYSLTSFSEWSPKPWSHSLCWVLTVLNPDFLCSAHSNLWINPLRNPLYPPGLSHNCVNSRILPTTLAWHSHRISPRKRPSRMGVRLKLFPPPLSLQRIEIELQQTRRKSEMKRKKKLSTDKLASDKCTGPLSNWFMSFI